MIELTNVTKSFSKLCAAITEWFTRTLTAPHFTV